VPD
jgi:hypothetical protein